jgi:hypothetical protein
VWPLLCESPVQRLRTPGQALRTAADLDVCYPLLSSVVPQVPLSCGPSAAHPGSALPCWTTQRCRSTLELVFDSLARWGPGTTRTWAGRSRHRCIAARSCSASTWPPSVRRPPTSSHTCAPTAPGSGALCSSSASSGPRPTGGGAVATSTAAAPRPPIANESGRRLRWPSLTGRPRSPRTVWRWVECRCRTWR